jgi:hypothetical protein
MSPNIPYHPPLSANKSVRIPVLNQMLVPISLALELVLQIRFIQSYQNLQEVLFTKKYLFLGSDAMWSGRILLTFQKNVSDLRFSLLWL